MTVLRSSLFMLVMLLATPLYAMTMLAAIPFGHRVEYALARSWCKLMVAAARGICGIRYRIVGSENLPPRPAVVLAKHQSAWETMFLLQLLPPQVWVVKRELLYLPFFGWGLAQLKPIAIDRKASVGALAQVGEQGEARLREGLWVVIFPEGTRTAPGETRRYAQSGAWLANRAKAPLLPIAHNAGEFWGRNAFLKRPGTITVSIGPVIEPAGETAEALTRRAQTWIEGEMQRIGQFKAAHV